jgi:hypothetical protein
MAKEIKYKVEGLLCKEKCPHTGNYIGSIFCFHCIHNDHNRTREQRKEEYENEKKIVLCNHPRWNE